MSNYELAYDADEEDATHSGMCWPDNLNAPSPPYPDWPSPPSKDFVFASTQPSEYFPDK